MPLSNSKSNSRLPSNIPLRTFPESSTARYRDNEESTSFLTSSHSGHRVDKPGSDSDDTESWVSTGDIGDQIDAEDPLRARLNDTLDEGALAGLKHLPRHHNTTSGSGSGKKEKKHVRIQEDAAYRNGDRSYRHTGAVNKEAIEIPEVVSLKPSRAQRLLSAIMPGSGKGFTGKPLMYVSRHRLHVLAVSVFQMLITMVYQLLHEYFCVVRRVSFRI